jgi:hypothetical protein
LANRGDVGPYVARTFCRSNRAKIDPATGNVGELGRLTGKVGPSGKGALAIYSKLKHSIVNCYSCANRKHHLINQNMQQVQFT